MICPVAGKECSIYSDTMESFLEAGVTVSRSEAEDLATAECNAGDYMRSQLELSVCGILITMERSQQKGSPDA